jgi:DnaJ-class molecular chaperone
MINDFLSQYNVKIQDVDTLKDGRMVLEVDGEEVFLSEEVTKYLSERQCLKCYGKGILDKYFEHEDSALEYSTICQSCNGQGYEGI